MGHDSFGGHMGFKRTKARISYTFYWPGLREDCLRYVQTCAACQIPEGDRLPEGCLQQAAVGPQGPGGTLNVAHIAQGSG